MTRFAAYQPQNHVQLEHALCRLASARTDARVRARRRGDMQKRAEQDTEAFDISTELQRADV